MPVFGSQAGSVPVMPSRRFSLARFLDSSLFLPAWMSAEASWGLFLGLRRVLMPSASAAFVRTMLPAIRCRGLVSILPSTVSMILGKP